MDYDDLIEAYGNGTRAADALGVSKQSVSNWKKKGIPPMVQMDIHIASKGDLRADAKIITKCREVLRAA